jgi:hypothetical protein
MTKSECRSPNDKISPFSPRTAAFVIRHWIIRHSSFVILPVFVVVLRLEICFLLGHTTVA